MSQQTLGMLLLIMLLPAAGALLARFADWRGQPRMARVIGVVSFGATLACAVVFQALPAEPIDAGAFVERGPVVDSDAFRLGRAVVTVPTAIMLTEVLPSVDVASLLPPVAGAAIEESDSEPSAQPTPEPTTTPLPVPSLEPTMTPLASPTPEPSSTQSSTSSPAPSLTPSATQLVVARPTVGTSTYVVRAGDTLRSIAERLNTSIDALMGLNDLSPENGDQLAVGQELFVPGAADAAGAAIATPSPVRPASTPTTRPRPVATPTTPPRPTQPPVAPTIPPSSEVRAYFVEAGDTLRSIADQFGISVERLLEFNGLTGTQGDQLSIGQRLFIPAAAAPPARSEVQAYFVEPGDTLRSIAEQFGISVEGLLEFNGLARAEGDQLRVGQRLFIPLR